MSSALADARADSGERVASGAREFNFQGLARRRVERLFDAARVPSLTLRVALVSRLVILLAGAGGVLTVSKRAGLAFNPNGMSPRLGALGNVVFGPAVRFDAFYYLGIASHGYATSAPRGPAFFPLYPFLIHVVGYLTRSPAVAGVAISLVSFVWALVLLHRLTELELGRPAADATVLLLAFAPLSFFFSAVYTESLFLLLSVGAVLAARRERWALAGVLGGLATLTRVTGLLLVVPIVIMHLRSRRRPGRQLGWALVPPAALLVYLAFLAASGFAWLAPFRAQSLWHRVTLGPIGGIASGLGAAIRSAAAIAGGVPVYQPGGSGPLSPDAENIFLFLVMVIAGAVLVKCRRRLPLPYVAYAATALLVCLSSPQTGRPLISLDRYLLTIFPLWMAAGAWVSQHRLTRVAVALGIVPLIFYMYWFSRWSFIA